MPGRDVVLRHTGQVPVLWGSGIVPDWSLRRTAEWWQMLPKRCTSFPEKAHTPKGKRTSTTMPVLWKDICLPICGKPRRLFAENAGDNGVKSSHEEELLTPFM